MADRFPEPEAIAEATKMASNSAELANYFLFRMTAIVNVVFRKNPETKEKIISSAKDFVEQVEDMCHSSSDFWNGIFIRNERFLNAQAVAARQTAKMQPHAIDGVTLHYAINEEGHYKHGYVSTGITEQETALLDKYFSQWLATHNYGVKGGVIYVVENDVMNEKKPLSSDEVSKLILEGGLDKFMESKGVYNLSFFKRDYSVGEEKAQDTAEPGR